MYVCLRCCLTRLTWTVCRCSGTSLGILVQSSGHLLLFVALWLLNVLWSVYIVCVFLQVSSGVIFDVECDLCAPNLGTKICSFKSVMFACNDVCLNLYVHDCVKFCVSQFDLGKFHMITLKLHWARKHFLHCNILVRVSRRLLFTRYNWDFSYVFLYIWGGKKALFNVITKISL